MIDYNKVIENDFEEKIYRSKYEEIIAYVNQFGPTDFWTIIKRVGGSERRMLRLINQMVNENDIHFDEKHSCFYSEEKEKIIKPEYCHVCNGDRILTSLFDKKIDKLKSIWANKPVPTFFFDQRPVNLKTSLKRASYFLTRGDLIGKNIILLGDDDLTSVAIASLGINCNIVAVDADKRLIEYINKVAKENHFDNLKAYELNVNNNVPEMLQNKFDVLFTDPTPEKIPFTVFMNCALELLKLKGIIYTSIYSSAMDKNLDLQKVICDMDLRITDIIPEFSEYKAIYELYTDEDIEIMKKFKIKFDEDSICFTESMFRMELQETSHRLKIEYKGSDLFGKATKRAICDIQNDLNKNDEYIMNLSRSLKQEADKKYNN